DPRQRQVNVKSKGHRSRSVGNAVGQDLTSTIGDGPAYSSHWETNCSANGAPSGKSDAVKDAISACPKTLAIAHQGHIYRCARTKDAAPTTTLVARPNIPTAPALATPPAPAVAIFVEGGRTRLTDVTDPVCIADKYECTGPGPAHIRT
uniref:Uncharacterized protein n=1 Tax=Romanomermis culicivorax TaxID=13658 RepID=A0A915HKG5_ROMCU